VYRWVEHTAELELEIEAPTETGVFREALAAFAELVGGHGGEPAVHAVRLRGEDRGTLLAAWLDELAFLAEMRSFVPEQAGDVELGDGVLTASVRGHVGEPPHLVKGATLHRLLFAEADGAWRARVVLDV
jgi:SHS2 domain-containing protein